VLLNPRVSVLVLLLVAPFGSGLLMTSAAQAVPIMNVQAMANQLGKGAPHLSAPNANRRKGKVNGPVAPPPVSEVLCGTVGPTTTTSPIVGKSPRAGRKNVKLPQPAAANVSRNKPRRGRDFVQLTPSVTPIVLPCIDGGANVGTESSETGTGLGDPQLTDIADQDFAILLSFDSSTPDLSLFNPPNFESNGDTYPLSAENFDGRIGQLQEVPEPTTLTSFGAGLICLTWMACRRRKPNRLERRPQG
jgi:hypothetical protein